MVTGSIPVSATNKIKLTAMWAFFMAGTSTIFPLVFTKNELLNQRQWINPDFIF
jgi:hypothetical protein